MGSEAPILGTGDAAGSHSKRASGSRARCVPPHLLSCAQEVRRDDTPLRLVAGVVALGTSRFLGCRRAWMLEPILKRIVHERSSSYIPRDKGGEPLGVAVSAHLMRELTTVVLRGQMGEEYQPVRRTTAAVLGLSNGSSQD